ncbi:MAG TPA: class I SAM-dependent methyltransferase, partial [Nocardioidaceae bacterium]|nr:class I SAM-dependent methyltransferase [Nocardioidaceae bacterium]
MSQPVSESSDTASVRPERFAVSEQETLAANKRDWDAYADTYQATHGAFLQDVGFLWGPEGHTEEQLSALGDVSGKRILEVGCGASQCARWLVTQGATAYGLDVSLRQLQHSLRIDDSTGVRVPTVCASGTHLPFASGSLDIVFSAFGAMQFVSEADTAVAEISRVLVPGGRFAFSITHPIRWAMPDDPGEEGLAVTNNYFDRTPYVEVDEDEQVRYVEHHRTLGDWVRVLAQHGFCLVDLIEPEWPEGHDRV